MTQTSDTKTKEGINTPDEYDYFKLMDRLSMVLNIVAIEIEDLYAVEHLPKAKQCIDTAMEALADAYQIAGGAWHNTFSK